MPTVRPFTPRSHGCLVVWHLSIDTRRVFRVVARHHLEQDRRVLHGAGDWPRLVERRGKGDDAPARAAAVSWLDADRAGHRRRLADRAAGVGGGGAHAKPRRHGRGRAARGSARHEIGVRALAPPGIDHRAVVARLVGRPHGELVIVELAEHHRARSPEIGGHRRLVGRREAVENVRARCGAHTLGGEQILDAERDAFQRPRLALAETHVALLRRFERTLRRREHEGVQRLVGAPDRLDMHARELFGGKLFARKRLTRLGNGKVGWIGHALYGLTCSHLTKAL